MKYERIGDGYTFECRTFTANLIGEHERIDFHEQCGEIVEVAFDMLKRLKKIRAEEMKDADESVGETIADTDAMIERIKNDIAKHSGAGAK